MASKDQIDPFLSHSKPWGLYRSYFHILYNVHVYEPYLQASHALFYDPVTKLIIIYHSTLNLITVGHNVVYLCKPTYPRVVAETFCLLGINAL